MKWLTIILGAVLFLAPFIFGYSSQAGQLWTSLIGGLLLAFSDSKRTTNGCAGSVWSFSCCPGSLDSVGRLQQPGAGS